MKKISMIVAVLVAIAIAAPAYAAKKGTPEYEKMVAIKKAQREAREAEKTNPSAKGKGFWAREAERSGFAGTAAMVGNVTKRILPEGKAS